MFQFPCRFAFLSTFRLSNRTPKIIANFDAASSKTRQIWWGGVFLKHTPKLIIFGTHNLHTFKHNTLINKLLRMQFYLFNICPKLYRRKWRKLRVTLPVNMAPFLNFTSSLLMQFFVQPLSRNSVINCRLAERCRPNPYIHTDFWSKFCLIYWTAPKLVRLLDAASKMSLVNI